MGVEHPKSLILLLHVTNDTGEDNVFDNVSEIASVEGVSVVHESLMSRLSGQNDSGKAGKYGGKSIVEHTANPFGFGQGDGKPIGGKYHRSRDGEAYDDEKYAQGAKLIGGIWIGGGNKLGQERDEKQHDFWVQQIDANAGEIAFE